MITITHFYNAETECPSQFEGQLSSGEYFYVRYRNGLLRVGFSKTSLYDAVGHYTYRRQIGGPQDGYITWDDVIPYFAEALNCRHSVG